MKQCPTCKTTYTDTTLRYCLADGALLNDAPVEQPTFIRDNTRLDTPQETIRMYAPRTDPTVVRPAGSSYGVLIKVLIALVGLGILVVFGAAIAGFIIFRSGADAPGNANTKVVLDPTNTPTPNETDETDELREQIANLEKLLNEQKRSDKPSTIPLSLPNQSSTTTTARVNSPGDGFLALRTYPNSQAGTKILEIPHGATISVGGCLNSSKIAKKAGRWCRANYDGYSGWVFDAFLIY